MENVLEYHRISQTRILIDASEYENEAEHFSALVMHFGSCNVGLSSFLPSLAEGQLYFFFFFRRACTHTERERLKQAAMVNHT